MLPKPFLVLSPWGQKISPSPKKPDPYFSYRTPLRPKIYLRRPVQPRLKKNQKKYRHHISQHFVIQPKKLDPTTQNAPFASGVILTSPVGVRPLRFVHVYRRKKKKEKKRRSF